jgi:hypothetical protein
MSGPYMPTHDDLLRDAAAREMARGPHWRHTAGGAVTHAFFVEINPDYWRSVCGLLYHKRRLHSTLNGELDSCRKCTGKLHREGGGS